MFFWCVFFWDLMLFIEIGIFLYVCEGEIVCKFMNKKVIVCVWEFICFECNYRYYILMVLFIFKIRFKYVEMFRYGENLFFF